MMSKYFVMKLLALTLLALCAVGLWLWRRAPIQPASYPVAFTDEQWKARLPEATYRILRHEATERPHSSPLDKEKRDGEFLCAGCQNVLFLSSAKFDSGTGWPSFFQPAAPDSVASRTDYKMILARTEVHCAKCGGHLGHVFGDGPAPTGQRYCINGGALDFQPRQTL
jgi:peptide-methionine (R)-S-oxide reductase